MTDFQNELTGAIEEIAMTTNMTMEEAIKQALEICEKYKDEVEKN